MATNVEDPVRVVMPALGLAQETGKLLQWLKTEGETVAQGEPLMQIETDKVTVEIEAPASGVLAAVSAAPGDKVRVGQVIAVIRAPDEMDLAPAPSRQTFPAMSSPPARSTPVPITPVAARIAAERNLDLSLVQPKGKRIEKADVLAFLKATEDGGRTTDALDSSRITASPKARRLAQERGVDISTLRGSGPDGAVIATDIPTASTVLRPPSSVSTVWRVMAERMSASWTSVPHFYLVREVAASALVEMHARIAPVIEKRGKVKVTFTDLLTKLVAAALRDHPRVNASWADGRIQSNAEINVGLATALQDGLIVPVIRNADRLTIGAIARRRQELVERAHAGRLRPDDIAGGTFTLTNLGMYNVDAFNAIVNPPQAAILAVGRIAERVVPVEGQPAVRPMVTLTLSCDHRVIVGARAAEFLDDLANLIQEPWRLLAAHD